MLKSNLSAADVDALRYWRFQPPDPRVQVRLAALYWRSQGMAHGDILRRCGLSKASFHGSLTVYIAGGIEPLKPIDHDRPQRELARSRPLRDAYVRAPPPATVAEAAAQLQERTGSARKPTPVRQLLTARGMTPRHVGMLPANADVDAPEACKNLSGAPASGGPGGPTRGLGQGGRALGVCPLFGEPLVRSTLVWQGALRAATVACPGGFACHPPRALHRRASDL